MRGQARFWDIDISSESFPMSWQLCYSFIRNAAT
jgi:hypothetical protein